MCLCPSDTVILVAKHVLVSLGHCYLSSKTCACVPRTLILVAKHVLVSLGHCYLSSKTCAFTEGNKLRVVKPTVGLRLLTSLSSESEMVCRHSSGCVIIVADMGMVAWRVSVCFYRL